LLVADEKTLCLPRDRWGKEKGPFIPQGETGGGGVLALGGSTKTWQKERRLSWREQKRGHKIPNRWLRELGGGKARGGGNSLRGQRLKKKKGRESAPNAEKGKHAGEVRHGPGEGKG